MRRFVVLMMLLVCLGWFSFIDTGNQVAAAPCCSECPGGGDPTEMGNDCAVQCGASSGTCYDNCIWYAHSCYRVCVFC